MGDKINTGVELLIVFSILALMQFFRYKFPHFCMHFFDGLSIFGVNSFGTLEKCSKHSKKDIDRFRRRQKYIFYFMCILFAIILIFYTISLFIHS